MTAKRTVSRTRSLPASGAAPRPRRHGRARGALAAPAVAAPVVPAGEARPAPVPVGALLEAEAEGLRLTLVTGRAGLRNVIDLSRVQRPGLALTGYTDYIRYGRVQIVGGSEINYLRKLSP